MLHLDFAKTTLRSLIATAALATLWPVAAQAQVLSFSANGSDGGGFGTAVTTIGDVDGDGIDDLVVGEPNFAVGGSKRCGRATVLSGRTGALIRRHTGEVGDERLGACAARYGDYDGDHVADYLVGVPGYGFLAGAVYLYSGATGARLTFYTFNIIGWNEGESVADIGDVDGDGFDEIVSGAPGVSLVHVFGGKSFFFYTIEDNLTDAFGTAMAACGDVNHDGILDFLIGAPLADTTSPNRTSVGRVDAVSGIDGAVITSWTGDLSFDRFGSSLTTIADLNADGVRDILVGAPGSTALGDPSGFVRVLSGKTFGVLRTTYGKPFDTLGASLAVIGDINRDGVADYVAGSPKDFFQAGAVRVISGKDGAFAHSFTGIASQDLAFGAAVAGGDFNGDGIADVVIGDPLFTSPGGAHPGLAVVYLGCPAISRNYGTGWPGKLGIPSLTTTPAPSLGATCHTTLTNSRGVTTAAVMMLGYSPADKHLSWGATLLVVPYASIILSLPAGGLTFTGTIPIDPSLCFFHLYHQALELDPFAVGGISLTPGLDLGFGFDL
jgi:hypothetical protein